MPRYRALAFYLLAPLFAGFIGSYFTAPAIPSWYALLNKPFFNPPSWVFAPVWTILYLMMGYAAYLVSQTKSKKEKEEALKFFWMQLVANVMWSILFFGLQNPGLAFVEILVLWALIAKTIQLFLKLSKPAGYLLIPYLAWTTFATLLNLAIVILN